MYIYIYIYIYMHIHTLYIDRVKASNITFTQCLRLHFDTQTRVFLRQTWHDLETHSWHKAFSDKIQVTCKRKNNNLRLFNKFLDGKQMVFTKCFDFWYLETTTKKSFNETFENAWRKPTSVTVQFIIISDVFFRSH